MNNKANKDYGFKNCKYCKKEFKKESSNQLFCTTRCRNYSRYGEKFTNCKNCSNKFQIVGNNNTYCSEKCREESKTKRFKPNIQINFKNKLCIICNKSFKPTTNENIICSDKCRKIKKRSSFRRSNKKTLNRKDKNIYKKPLYTGIKYSVNEDLAISTLKKNAFTASQIGEVLGRTGRSIHNRLVEAEIGKYVPPTDVEFDEKKEIKKIIKSLDNNTKKLELMASLNIYKKLIINGFEIYKGREGDQFDILALKNNKFFKIQLKLTRFNEKGNNFETSGNTFFHYDTHKHLYDKFKYNDVDFFIFYCLGVDVAYIIPLSEIKKIKRHSLSIQYYPHRPYRNMNPIIDTQKFKEKFELIK